MIRICSKCGALSLDNTGSCSFCDVSAVQNDEIPAPGSAVAGQTGSSDAPEPEWRLEVSRRLEQYRARRGYVRSDDSQSGLPFRVPPRVRESHPAGFHYQAHEQAREHRRPRTTLGQRQAERVEICIQPKLDFLSSPDDRARPQTALVPVASLAERRWAGILDAFFLGFTCAGFLGLFRSLGGQIVLEKMDAIVYLSVAFLFYAVYFILFVTLAGSTPGMQLRGLTIVRLDGSLPDTRQLLWRDFGYLLSGATFLLGFIWAIWDEDHFTWQDRISQTYITAAAPLSDLDLLDVPTRQHNFAHK